jgi:hypothetical protein
MLVACSTYSSILKMEAVYSSGMLVDFFQTTQHYIPEGSTLHANTIFQSIILHVKLLEKIGCIILRKRYEK